MANELLDYLHLVQVRFAREEGLSANQLCEDTADGPQVDAFVVVFVAEHNFRSSVPPGDDVLC